MKRVIAGILAATMLFSMTACADTKAAGNTRTRTVDNGTTDSEETIMNPSTDISVVSQIFPKLEGIEAVEFEVKKLGSGDDSVPGPTDYQYQGYITLTAEAAQNYASSYEWNDSKNDVTFETITARSGNFKSAPGFLNDIIKKSKYTGRAWLDGNTILFCVNTF